MGAWEEEEEEEGTSHSTVEVSSCQLDAKHHYSSSTVVINGGSLSLFFVRMTDRALSISIDSHFLWMTDFIDHGCLPYFAGSPAYDSVRSLSYQEADVFLLCYKISDPVSLYNVKSRWWPELRRHRPDAPIVLCGCQQDLRIDAATISQLSKIGRAPVSREQGLAICCEVEAVNYVETSACDPMMQRECLEAFELCALAAIKCGKLRRKTSVAFSPASTSSSQKNLANTSFGSSNNSSSRRNNGSLKKSACNVSFSGSENLNNPSVVSPIMEDDDVFPPYVQGDSMEKRSSRCLLPPLSPRFMRGSTGLDRQRKPHRSSLGMLRSFGDEDTTVESLFKMEYPDASAVSPPLLTSTVKSPLKSSSSVMLDSPAMIPAQVRPNGLSRRTSFRTPDHQHLGKPVKSPLSPIGNEVSGSSNGGAIKKAPPVGFESLKSHASTGSQGSTGSKVSSSSSTSNSGGVVGVGPAGSLMDPDMPDTEDPELLKQLRFVSPKAGVFRPVSEANLSKAGGGGGKRKQSCCVM